MFRIRIQCFGSDKTVSPTLTSLMAWPLNFYCVLQNVMYLRQKQGLNMVKAVLDTLTETAYSTRITTTKVMIQSKDSSVLVEFRNQSKYETVYKVEKTISDISDSAIKEIKKNLLALLSSRKYQYFPHLMGSSRGKPMLWRGCRSLSFRYMWNCSRTSLYLNHMTSYLTQLLR